MTRRRGSGCCVWWPSGSPARARRPPLDAVRRLTAVQAQDFPGALTSVALRTHGPLPRGRRRGADAGDVVRSWPMRGTLHLTVAEDLPWMLALLDCPGAGRPVRPAGAARAHRRRRRPRPRARGRGDVRRPPAGPRAVLAVMADGGVDVAGQRGIHLLCYLSQTGTLCLGPREDGEQRFVLLDEWIRAPRRLEREEALAELALRFFRGHGPATVKDLARWAVLRMTESATGLAAVRDELRSLEVDGVEYFLDPETPDLLAACRDEACGTFCCPGSTSSCSATATGAPWSTRSSSTGSSPAATGCSGRPSSPAAGSSAPGGGPAGAPSGR